MRRKAGCSLGCTTRARHGQFYRLFVARGIYDVFMERLTAKAAALRVGAGAPAIWPVKAALQDYAAEVAAVRSEGLTRGISGDVTERFFAVGFSLEQMLQNLKDLERCVAEWAETKPAKTETGLVVQVPPFINEGETIRVDTAEGAYMSRA